MLLRDKRPPVRMVVLYLTNQQEAMDDDCDCRGAAAAAAQWADGSSHGCDVRATVPRSRPLLARAAADAVVDPEAFRPADRPRQHRHQSPAATDGADICGRQLL